MVSRGTIGIVFILILVCAYLLSNRPPGSRQELEKQAAVLRARLDSLNEGIIALRARDSLLVAKLAKDRDSLQTALKQAQKQAVKYAKIKPLIRPSDAQLDSAIARLYPR